MEYVNLYLNKLLLKLTSLESFLSIHYLIAAIFISLVLRPKILFKAHNFWQEKNFHMDILCILSIPIVAHFESKIWHSYSIWVDFFSKQIASVAQAEINTIILISIWTNISFIFLDFWIYLSHRFFHQISLFYCLHSTHHAPTKMYHTTVARVHPFELILKTCWELLGLSIIYLFFCVFVKNMNEAKFFSVSIYSIFFIVRKVQGLLSHTWIIYPKWLSYIFISPAMHVVHHSYRAEHVNKNYGRLFAIWDWVFGTIYIPKKNEELSIGIHQKSKYYLRGDSPFDQFIKPIFFVWKQLVTYF